MNIYRYSQWDGSQDLFDLNADELMNELERQLMSYGDLSYALRLMQHGGFRDSQGRQLPGIQDLLQRLRQRRQSQLDKYNLGSVMDEIRQKLDNIVKTERQGIQRKLDEAKQKAGEESRGSSTDTRTTRTDACDGRAADDGPFGLPGAGH